MRLRALGPPCRGDIRDYATLRDAIIEHEVTSALHFAACAYVGESVINPQKYYDNNVAGTLSLLRAMLDTDIAAIVFSSSCAIYGEPEKIPITESCPKQPVNPYGASKLMIERVLMDYVRAYGLQYVALRYFNAAGADPDGEVGELREPETHLIPRAMMSIQGHLDDFEVFGSDYPTPDGTAIRDYIHVSDLADAHVAALRRLQDGKPSGAYNLGTGHGYSVREVLAAISAETGEDLRTPVGLRREGDPAELVADASLGRKRAWLAPASFRSRNHRAHRLGLAQTRPLQKRRRKGPRERRTFGPPRNPIDLRHGAAAAADLQLERQEGLGCRPQRHGRLGAAAAPSKRRLHAHHRRTRRARSHAADRRSRAGWRRGRPQAIFLAAAKVGGIVANMTSPADFLYDNLTIAANVIHAAAANGVEKLLFLGSSCIYPKFAEQPIKEDALLTGPLEPTNEWYAIAKIAGLSSARPTAGNMVATSSRRCRPTSTDRETISISLPAT